MSHLYIFELDSPLMTVECYGDDTAHIFHDTSLFPLLILLVHVSKFNVYNTLITLSLRLAYITYARVMSRHRRSTD